MERYFSDPKVWIAILAVVIAVINFIALTWFRWDQNARWDALNTAQLEVDKVHFVAWEEMDKSTAQERDWGYTPRLYSVVDQEEYVHTGRFRVYDQLVLYDSAANKKIEGSAAVQTVAQATQEATRIGLDPGSVAIRKYMMMEIYIKNTGSTYADNVKSTLDVSGAGVGNQKRIHESISSVRLHRDASVNVVAGFYLPLNGLLPKPLLFDLSLSYTTVRGELIERNIRLEYHYDMNFWVYGS